MADYDTLEEFRHSEFCVRVSSIKELEAVRRVIRQHDPDAYFGYCSDQDFYAGFTDFGFQSGQWVMWRPAALKYCFYFDEWMERVGGWSENTSHTDVINMDLNEVL